MAGEQSQAPPLDAAASAATAEATAARKAELQKRGTWQGSLVTESHIEWARKSRRILPEVSYHVPPAG